MIDDALLLDVWKATRVPRFTDEVERKIAARKVKNTRGVMESPFGRDELSAAGRVELDRKLASAEAIGVLSKLDPTVVFRSAVWLAAVAYHELGRHLQAITDGTTWDRSLPDGSTEPMVIPPPDRPLYPEGYVFQTVQESEFARLIQDVRASGFDPAVLKSSKVVPTTPASLANVGTINLLTDALNEVVEGFATIASDAAYATPASRQKGRSMHELFVEEIFELAKEWQETWAVRKVDLKTGQFHPVDMPDRWSLT